MLKQSSFGKRHSRVQRQQGDHEGAQQCGDVAVQRAWKKSLWLERLKKKYLGEHNHMDKDFLLPVISTSFVFSL